MEIWKYLNHRGNECYWRVWVLEKCEIFLHHEIYDCTFAQNCMKDFVGVGVKRNNLYISNSYEVI